MTSPANSSKKESSWINVAKACAIIGVVIQHVNGYLYTDQRIFYSVWWVVSLFIMIGGYNAMSSYLNRGYVVMKRRLLGIGIPYVIATIIYHVFDTHHFNLYELCLTLSHFNATGPLYYVAAYIQLLLITPVLIAVIQYCEKDNSTKRYAFAWILILGLCLLISKTTNIFDIAIGGGRLFAGPWLFFWFAGMFVRIREERCTLQVDMVYRMMIYTFLLLLWELIFSWGEVNHNYIGPLFRGSGVGMTWANTIETFIVFFWFKEVVSWYETKSCGCLCKIFAGLNYLGKHTLYVFLYHMLFKSIYKGVMPPPPQGLVSSILYAIACLGFMVFMPVWWERTEGRLKEKWCNFMLGVKVD
ncbi:acyltransferase family protein [Selenomonas ruminantium]|uniref:Fucose 4-O-acetylase n=1 Tax=Selenomonas ruminantium TaxID=971 RepID=A0A1K1PJG1_SELRU|nr:acyltransferase [Selenomonas ruminantium]SFW47593.1 Fucose 4-O-acetylase [Selenomonas ruminantium]